MKNFINLKNNKKFFNESSCGGFTLVEVLIACFVISTITLALMSSASKGIELSIRALRQAQASMITEEGVEAVKVIRDNNWDDISVLDNNVDYYLSFDTGANSWTLSDQIPTPAQIDEKFKRTVVFSEVYRDTNDDIASSGTLDTGTRRVVVNTDWLSSGQTVSKSITFYISNIFN